MGWAEVQSMGTDPRSKGHEDLHQLGGGAVASGLDQLQVGDVPGPDEGSGLHTHAVQVSLTFFWVI